MSLEISKIPTEQVLKITSKLKSAANLSGIFNVDNLIDVINTIHLPKKTKKVIHHSYENLCGILHLVENDYFNDLLYSILDSNPNDKHNIDGAQLAQSYDLIINNIEKYLNYLLYKTIEKTSENSISFMYNGDIINYKKSLNTDFLEGIGSKIYNLGITNVKYRFSGGHEELTFNDKCYFKFYKLHYCLGEYSLNDTRGQKELWLLPNFDPSPEYRGSFSHVGEISCEKAEDQLAILVSFPYSIVNHYDDETIVKYIDSCILGYHSGLYVGYKEFLTEIISSFLWSHFESCERAYLQDGELSTDEYLSIPNDDESTDSDDLSIEEHETHIQESLLIYHILRKHFPRELKKTQVGPIMEIQSKCVNIIIQNIEFYTTILNEAILSSIEDILFDKDEISDLTNKIDSTFSILFDEFQDMYSQIVNQEIDNTGLELDESLSSNSEAEKFIQSLKKSNNIFYHCCSETLIGFLNKHSINYGVEHGEFSETYNIKELYAIYNRDRSTLEEEKNKKQP